ncbi:site-specific integrase [Anthocerotibacter panamensis]|uniref:site-specific integrase n=1 Tax=Anthocerotibacter panamensis TaxID=2857077 RepID=UPI001C403EFE|nr:site-specific integrase [Anthocerotibacter panamensis]
MSFDSRIDPKILQSNNRLKAARIGVRLYRKEERLLLRATFPPRPGSGRTQPHQQWLALGVYANTEGLKHAEALAKTIGGQLARQAFDWTPYLAPRQQPLDQRPLLEQLEAFQTHFLAQRGGHSASTLRSVYVPYFKQLQQTAHLYPQLDLSAWVEKTLQQIPAQTRGRQLACTAFKGLLNFLGHPTEHIAQYRGSYNQRRVVPRQLPDDAAIVHWFQAIPNPEWRLVYGLLATFGLRPHECFFVDLNRLRSEPGTLWVGADTKTGARETWPFYPEWVEQFQLCTGALPAISRTTTLKTIGTKVNTQFRRYGVPFHPYLLRHAWAVRTIHFGLDSSIAAPMMGHSVQVHTGVYHYWLTRRDQQTAVERALQTGSPSPPVRPYP